MSRAVLLAVRPTARAVSWTPLVVAGAALLALAALVRLEDQPGGRVALLSVATLAAVTALALHDPAQALLAAMPVPPMARRLLRAGIATVAATLVWLVLELVLPGPPSGLLPLGLALVLGALALATWLPSYVDRRAVAALPLLWLMVNVVVGSAGVTTGLSDSLLTDAWIVAAFSAVALVLGRHR